jgi:tetratricopeptide (TPR) repeat protein
LTLLILRCYTQGSAFAREGTSVRSVTRHQLKQDRFSRVTLGAAEATVHWSVEHRSKLLFGSVALLIVIGLAVGAWYHMNQQDQEASVVLGEGVRDLETPIRPAGMPPQPDTPTFASAEERATEARKRFQSVVGLYPHTRAAEFARYFSAVASESLDDHASAERELKQVSALHNSDLASLASFALAAVYRDTNRGAEAIALYKKLLEKPTRTVSKVACQMALADTYQSSGQVLEAKRIYEQVEKENPGSEAGQLASSKLVALK